MLQHSIRKEEHGHRVPSEATVARRPSKEGDEEDEEEEPPRPVRELRVTEPLHDLPVPEDALRAESA